MFEKFKLVHYGNCSERIDEITNKNIALICELQAIKSLYDKSLGELAGVVAQLHEKDVILSKERCKITKLEKRVKMLPSGSITYRHID